MRRREFLLAAAGGAMARVAPAGNEPVLVRMGYFDKFWPMSRRDEDGAMRGILIDSLDRLGREAGVRFEHYGFPWARAQLMIERSELDAFCTVRSDLRLKYAEFCETPLVAVNYGVYHRANDSRAAKIASIEAMRAFRQGTYLGGGYAKQYLEPERMEPADADEETVLRRIALGTLDIFVEGDLVPPTKIKALGLAEKLRYTPLPFLPKGEFRFGLRRDFPGAAQVLTRMERAIRAAHEEGVLTAIVARYRKFG